MRRVGFCEALGLASLVLLQAGAWAQTTQGLISGRLLNSRDGQPVAGAEVSYVNDGTNDSGIASSGESGYFVLPLLSPGQYQIRVSGPAYQAQEVQQLELRVSGRIELNFLLRPLTDVWEAGEYRSVFLPGAKTIVTYFGPDVDSSKSGTFEANVGKTGTLESSVSNVITPKEIEDLPLQGRDVFDMLVTQPGVTADTTTARSLGLSANGQRSASSNFLLDGLEFNNYLVSGPVTAVAPEAIQEYRLSTSSFSAEYGGTAGYLANAVTKAGTSQWHGIGYFDIKNDVLNANDFQSNLNGIRRQPDKEDEPGFQVGGPILKDRLFLSASLDYLRSYSQMPPETMTVPTTYLLSILAPNSMAATLLNEFPGPQVTAGSALSAPITLTPPVTLNRWLGLARVDWVLDGGKERLMIRPVVSRTSRPDYIWSPYPAFTTRADDNAYGVAMGLQSSLRSNLTNEARLGGTWTVFNLPRNEPNIPLITVPGVVLPSSTNLFTTFDNRNRTGELLDNLVWSHGPHLVTAGGGVLLRGISGTLSPDASGNYAFRSIGAFANDTPFALQAPVDRADLPAFVAPQFGRQYRDTQFFLFIQDTYRVTSRFVLNIGVRYDAFGSPQNTGPNKDTLVQLGPGSDLADRIAAATLVTPASGNQTLYHADKGNFAPRFGFSYSPTASGNTVIRGSYGIFFDRFFDNIWQNLRNNSFNISTYGYVAAQGPYLTTPLAQVLPLYASKGVETLFPNFSQQSSFAPLTLFQPGLRTPYVQSFFLGAQQRLKGGWTLEGNLLGSLGRELITQDVINRGVKTGLGQPIGYRANQGSSDYGALALVARHISEHYQFQAAYTWSHTIDNQSEVLRSDYFNLSPTVLTTSQQGRLDISAFSQQYNSSADRGNADFDQRQNLVFLSVVDLPAVWQATKVAELFRGWRFSQLAAFRSGVPYTVFAGLPYALPYNQRADLVNPSELYAGRTPVPGGVQILNAAAFAAPLLGQPGNTGRNEFTGPGFYNIDISLSREFALPVLGEAGRLTLRGDAFNFLNHANLNVPNFNLASGSFGVATYGRTQASTTGALPVLSPVNDTGRQVQLIVRVTF